MAELSEYDQYRVDTGSAYVFSVFPWLEQMGLQTEIRQWLIDGLEGEALLGALRKTPQYQQMFPWIKREDGTLRMTESEYLKAQTEYRRVMRQYGFEEPKNAMEYGAFFTGEVSADELKERLEVYRGIERAGRPAREAFYIYAGMKLSVDDMYEALVEPQRWAALESEYNVRVAQNPLDYDTWVARATEVGLQRVTDTLKAMESEGAVTGTAIERIRAINPDFAKQMMDVLYHGGDPGAGEYMESLDELMATFEEAMIGSASHSAGLGLPDKQRVARLREAGVQRSQALRRYAEFGAQKNSVAGAVKRFDGGTFGGREFEAAEWLGDAGLQGLMDRAMAQEEALGKAKGGGVSLRLDDMGLEQRGFETARY